MKFFICILSVLGALPVYAKVPSKKPEVVLAPMVEGHKREQHEAFGKKFMITSSGEGTSQIAADVVKQGGNIFDVFAAMSFAISVERPQSTGLGGGGFMVGYFPKLKQPKMAVDFREKAPLTSDKNIFLDGEGKVIPKKSLDTIYAAGTPGLVAGVLEVHSKYGKLSREKIMQGAIDLAEKGFKVYPHLANAIKDRWNLILANEAAKKIFAKADGSPYVVGDVLVQKDLAETLRKIAKNGRDEFYKGSIMQAIVGESKRLGGLLSAKDFESYNVVFRNPVYGTFRGYEVISMPPPSSGGTHVIQLLNMIEPLQLSKLGPQHPTTVHMISSAMQRVFADRAAYLGDSDFAKVPVKGLTSKKYAASLVASIDKSHATPSTQVREGDATKYESSETTHFTIMDGDGNALASTQTINGFLGSTIVVPGTGIVLNNEMDDFSAKAGDSNLFGAIGGKNNLVEAGKRPLSSMSPTILIKNKRPVLALGTPSGTRILTCVALTITNYVEFKLPLYESVAAIRYHHQWQPDEIRMDPPFFTPATMAALEKYGYKLNKSDLGCKINAIAYENKKLHGVSDPRSEGLSVGF